MYSITDLKKDTIIQIDGTPYKVTDYAQKQMGRGGSIVNVKLKNLLDGSVLPKTFKGADKIESADVTNQTVQFLYADGDTLHFMDNNSFEQFEVMRSLVGDAVAFLKEGSEADIQLFDGRIINVALPIKVTLAVSEAPDVVRGDTQSTVMKEVTLETGATLMTPIFIKSGDQIVIDTRNGSYVERSKS